MKLNFITLLALGLTVLAGHTSALCMDTLPGCDVTKCGGLTGKVWCKKTCGTCVSTTQAPTGPATNAPNYKGCGYQGYQSRVVGGTKSKQSQWPWQSSLSIGGKFSCGATLIAPQWVVTAGHCIQAYRRANQYSFKFGDLDRYDISGKEYYARGEKLFKHPSYNTPLRKDNDIALIKLDRPVPFSSDITPACLPRTGEQIPVGKKCFVSGWGKTDYAGQAVYDLQHAPLQIISNKQCCETNCDRWTPNIPSKMVCAKNREQATSACHGDSGGPFVCQGSNGRWFLQGVVSWGSGRCNAFQKATVFTRVPKYMTWINETIKNN